MDRDNYIIKVYDKDMVFKRTIPRKEIDGDIRYSSALNSGFGSMPLTLVGREETQDTDGTRIDNLGVVHGDVIQVIDPQKNIVTEYIYRGEFYRFDGSGGHVISNATHSANLITTSHVIVSLRFRLNADGTASANSQQLFCLPRCYGYVRETDNQVRIRFDNAGGRESLHVLGNGDRERHHYIGAVYNNGTNRTTAIWIDGVLKDTDTHAVGPSNDESGGGYVRLGSAFSGTIFFNGDIRDFHIWKFTGNSIGVGDIDKIYAGIQPTATTGIAEYLNRKTAEGSGTTAEDSTVNNRDGTHTGGITHQNETTTLLPFASTYKEVEDVPIYAGIVSLIDRIIKPGAELHKLDVLGLQTIFNYKLYLYSGSTSFTRTADPAVMLKEIIDFYPDYFYYTGGSIPNFGTTLAIQFDNVTCMEAIKKILEATGWYIQRDATGLVTFFERDASPTATHVLDFRRDIVEITKKEDWTTVVNSVKVKRSGGTVTANDAGSQATYGVLE